MKERDMRINEWISSLLDWFFVIMFLFLSVLFFAFDELNLCFLSLAYGIVIIVVLNFYIRKWNCQ